ncbi:hypothetical protein ACP275_09G121300 [Erythranthe tilingii]
MSKNEAARTCVFSKRWRFLWTNRLNLSYDETSPSYKGPHRSRLFTSHVTKALQWHLDIRNNHRIEDHRIEEFHLVVSHPKSVPFIEKWIETLTSLGAKELFLAINPSAPTSKPFSYVVHLGSAFFFKAKSLTSLHLFRCKLSQNTTLDEKILFDRLQRLRLRDVHFTDEQIFENIITSCPLLVSMWFQECRGLRYVKLVHKYIKHFAFINEHTQQIDGCTVEIHQIPEVETIYISGSKIRFCHHRFGKLENLTLKLIKFDSSLQCYEFPHLRTFRIYDHFPVERFQLRVSARELSKFRFTGSAIPSITLEPISTNYWRSYINLWLQLHDNLDDVSSWFHRLSTLLHELRRSKIFLSVAQNPSTILDIGQDVIDGNNNYKPPVVVKRLELSMGHLASFPSFLNCLFSICRPMIIVPKEERVSKELTEFLCNFLTKRDGEFRMQDDMEKFRIESFDTSGQKWQPTVSECELSESNRIRFRLKWSEANYKSSPMQLDVTE